MKITLKTEDLLKEMSFVSQVADGTLNPNCWNVLFEVQDKTLRLTGTNSSTVARTEVPIDKKDSQKNLITAANGREITKSLSQIRAESVNLSFTENNLTITALSRRG